MTGWTAPKPPRRRKSALLSPRMWAFGPRLAQMVVTRRCNLDCGYCNEYDKTSAPVPAETLKQRIDKLASLSTWYIQFTGGEPMLHPDLFELIRYAAKYRFLERKLLTNGFLLNPERIERLNDAGLTHMQISIDGIMPNDVTVKVLKPLKPKLEHLRKHAKFTVRINAVLGAGNDEEVLELVDYAKGIGFLPRVCVIHDGDGQMVLDEEGKELLARVRNELGSRWKEAGDYRTRLITDGSADFKCRAGSRYLYIDEFGDVHWCSQQRGVFTKPLLEYTVDDLRRQFYTQKDCSPTCTVGCVRTASRADQWRRQPLRLETAPQRSLPIAP